MQSGYWPIGKWKTVPVFFHWTIFLWLPWYWWRDGSLVAALATFLAFVALLFAHELGHALAARRRRVKVFAIRLYLLHGQCEHQQPYYEAEDVFIAWGGVAAQLVVLLLALAAKYALLVYAPTAYPYLAPVLFVLIQANLAMVAINLVPVAPLDGYKAWRVIPLLLPRLAPASREALYRIRSAADFKKRRAASKESQRMAQEVLDRLRKK